MSCKDCQCSKTIDQTLSEDTKTLDISDKKGSDCTCTSCAARSIPEASGCSCCRPPRRRNCRCCPCRSCCDCCSCCSSGRTVCAAVTGNKPEQVETSGCKTCAAKKEEPQPKVLESCKCCAAKEEVKPKAVCASCGCDKCS